MKGLGPQVSQPLRALPRQAGRAGPLALLLILLAATGSGSAVTLCPEAAGSPPEQIHVGLVVDGITHAATGLSIQWMHACEFLVSSPHVEWMLDGVAQDDLEGLIAGQPVVQHGTTVLASSGHTSPVLYAAATDVPAGGVVEYRVVNGANSSAWYTVRMPGLTPLRLLAFGDQGVAGVADDGTRIPGQQSAALDVIGEALQHELDLHAALGDLSYADYSATFGPVWDRYFRMNQPLFATVATMPLAGNHERESAYEPLAFNQFQQRFVLPEDEFHYGFRVGPVYFVAMNSDVLCTSQATAPAGECEEPGMAVDPDVTVRLMQELRDAQLSGADWIVVMHHHNVYSVAGHEDYTAIRNHWTPFYEAAGVDLVLSAHAHNYQRTFQLLESLPQDTDNDYRQGGGVVYVGAGGGGTNLATIDPALVAATDWLAVAETQHSFVIVNATATSLRVEAFNRTGDMIDSFVITRTLAPGGPSMPPLRLPNIVPPGLIALVGLVSVVPGRRARN